MEWTIQQTARMTGTTSRALRHYDELGLVRPSRVGENGYRHYDDAALLRLQRVLLLRQLGLGLATIATILDEERDEAAALTTHLTFLRQEQERLARQIAAVEHTIDALSGNGELMATNMFDGFDHHDHREEVERQWGRRAARTADGWWAHLDDAGRRAEQDTAAQLVSDWATAAASATPSSPAAQDLARRHLAWLAGFPGVPMDTGEVAEDYVRGLASLYVDDERFATTYGGGANAAFVRDALLAHLDAGR